MFIAIDSFVVFQYTYHEINTGNQSPKISQCCKLLLHFGKLKEPIKTSYFLGPSWKFYPEPTGCIFKRKV